MFWPDFSRTKADFLNIVLKNLVLATLYYIFGRIGLYLASDPAMATIFWPGAGIAMAAVYSCGYRMLPGVYLGAVLVNLTIVYPSSVSIFAIDTTIMRVFLMGIPPMLQALAGSFMIQRVLGLENRLETLRAVLWFSVLAGPVSCLISASLSEFILYSFGVTAWRAIPLSWATWYVGDMLGTLVFAPTGVLLINSSVSRHRKQSVILPLLFLFVLVISVFFYAIGNEKRNRLEGLKTDSTLIVNSLNNSFNAYLEQVKSVRSFFQASEYVSEREFRLYLEDVFGEYPAMESLFWAPRIPKEDLADFERRASQTKGFSFRVVGTQEDGEQKPVALTRDYYFPLYYSAQRFGLNTVQGEDVGENELIRSRLDVSAKTQRPVSSVVSGIFSPDGEAKVALFFPLYTSDVSGERPQDFLRGFIVGIFSPYEMLTETLVNWQSRGIDLTFVADNQDENVKSNETVIFLRRLSALHHRVSFNMLDEHWQLVVSLDKEFLEAHVNWALWYVLGGSFLFTFIVSGFLLVVTGHGAVTEAVVQERTRQLNDQTGFLKLIMDHVPDLVFVKNRKHELIAANEAFLGLYSREDQKTLIGRTGLEIFTEEEQELFKEQDNLAFCKGYSEVFESNTDYRGIIRTFFTRKIRFEDDAGHPFLLGLSRDMTELLTVQSHLESILMTTADGFMVIEHDGKIATFNKACERIFGYEPQEIVGKPVWVLEPDYQAQDEKGNFFYFVRQAGKTGDQVRHELLAKHKDETVFPIYLAASEVRVGHTSFYSAIVRDISEEKKAKEDLRRSNQELEDFAYVASHDLKAPLRHLSLSANFLIRNYSGQFDDKAHELLNIISKSSERMFEMIDSLLAYSSVGRKDVQMSAVALNEVMEDVLDNLSAQIEAVKARISVGPLPEIHGNRNLMIQLFQNLVENALKYRKGSVSPVVKVHAGSSGRFNLITVSDNGIGIEKEYKDKVFKIFQRLHSDAQYPGTGIGLAICQRIVEFHGGTIELDEDYAEGSRFIIKLPAV